MLNRHTLENYKKLKDSFGELEYSLKICEELAEFQTSLLHKRHKKVEKFDVIDEIVDVYIQLEKAICLLGNFDEKEIMKIQDYISDEFNSKHLKLEEIIK